jgi:hypothetical protein
MGETDRLLAAMSDKNFPIDIHEVSKDALLGRMAAYYAVSEILLGLIITGCYWSNTYGRLGAEALDRVSNPSRNFTGSLVWERLRWYPAMLLIYGGGIASVAAGKYENLAVLLTKPKVLVINKGSLPAAVALCSDTLFESDIYSLITDTGTDPYALNRHLLEALKGPFAEIMPIEEQYRRNFNTFEYLLTLIHADLQAKLNVSDSFFWGPPGLFMSERERRNGAITMRTVKQQAQEQGSEWPP